MFFFAACIHTADFITFFEKESGLGIHYMLQLKSLVEVADNTGPKVVSCFQVLGDSKRRYAYIGDIIVGSVKKVGVASTIKQGEIVRGVVVRTRHPLRRSDGSYIRFSSNAIVIIDKDGNPKGTRIFGPIPRELRKNFMKIVSLAPEVV